MSDFLSEAQREVDEMLPGTPRIGTEPTPNIRGCIAVPSDSTCFCPRLYWSLFSFMLGLVITVASAVYQLAEMHARMEYLDFMRDEIVRIGERAESLRIELERSRSELRDEIREATR